MAGALAVRLGGKNSYFGSRRLFSGNPMSPIPTFSPSLTSGSNLLLTYPRLPARPLDDLLNRPRSLEKWGQGRTKPKEQAAARIMLVLFHTLEKARHHSRNY